MSSADDDDDDDDDGRQSRSSRGKTSPKKKSGFKYKTDLVKEVNRLKRDRDLQTAAFAASQAESKALRDQVTQLMLLIKPAADGQPPAAAAAAETQAPQGGGYQLLGTPSARSIRTDADTPELENQSVGLNEGLQQQGNRRHCSHARRPCGQQTPAG